MFNLGVPEIILIIVAFGILGGCIIFPIWGYKAGAERTIGAIPGLLLGFFLNIIGIAIIYCTPKIGYKDPYALPARSSADELEKFKQLLDSGAISEAEFNNQKARILNSYRQY